LKKDLLTLRDLDYKADFEHLFDRALQLKKRYARGIPGPDTHGRRPGA
jgi:ornithine carbamoyltransferase